MDSNWLEDNNFRSISPTKFLRNFNLWSATHLDAHVNLTFENASLQRCDLHGTIRTAEDAKKAWKGTDPTVVGRAIWVYSDKTWRSPSNLKFWLRNASLTYSDIKSACRELAAIVQDCERDVGLADCEVLTPSKANAKKIDYIGVSIT